MVSPAIAQSLREIAEQAASSGYPAVEAAALTVITVATLYEAYQLYREKGENEYTREADAEAQRTGKDVCTILKEYIKRAQCIPDRKERNEALKKLSEARKFKGCKRTGSD
jgi:hypothetical protein